MARVLLYDADCGFCTSSAHRLVDLGCDVELTPWQEWTGLAEHGITPAAANAALHLVDGGKILIGHEAVAGALVSARWVPVRLAGRLLGVRALRPAAKRGYAWVAANRYRLPGATAACALPGVAQPQSRPAQ